MSLKQLDDTGHSGNEQGDVNTTQNRQKYCETNLSESAKDICARDNKYFLHQNLSTPVMNVLSKAYGIYIEDIDGKKYIDMHGNGVHNAGFSNPEVIKAVKDQLDKQMSFCPRRYTNTVAVDLAQKLAEITPGDLCKSLFCPGGSEAIEMAITLAKQITGHFKTISFWDSFHGAGFAAASIGGEELFKGGAGPMMPGAMHVEFPNYYRNPWRFSSQEEVDNEYLRQIKIVCNIIGLLFIRAYERGERVYQSMSARGFDGNIITMNELKYTKSDIFFYIIFTGIIVTIKFWSLF